MNVLAQQTQNTSWHTNNLNTSQCHNDKSIINNNKYNILNRRFTQIIADDQFFTAKCKGKTAINYQPIKKGTFSFSPPSTTPFPTLIISPTLKSFIVTFAHIVLVRPGVNRLPGAARGRTFPSPPAEYAAPALAGSLSRARSIRAWFYYSFRYSSPA